MTALIAIARAPFPGGILPATKLWGALYLLAIPLFAGWYTLLSNDFYHATAQYEPSLGREAAALLPDLRRDLLSSDLLGLPAVTGYFAVDTHGKRTGEWSVNVRDVEFRSIRIEKEGRLSLLVTFPIIPRDGAIRIAHFRLIIPAQPDDSVRTSPTDDWRDTRVLTIEGGESLPIDRSSLMAPFACHEIWFWPSNMVCLHRPISHRLIALEAASRGFPAEVRGSFSRMFYLSAVTITTVGFGDIVPLTPAARVAVTTEAIVGIVLIGLFLNSLAYRLQPKVPRKVSGG